MYEAAVAHYQATGKRNLLKIAIKNADLIAKTFGPHPGQLTHVPGHEEIEIGLVRLYRATGDGKYLDLAKFFVDMRGNKEQREASRRVCPGPCGRRAVEVATRSAAAISTPAWPTSRH